MVMRLLGSSLLVALSVAVQAAPVTLGPRHKDESNGYQVQIPRKWEQVPTKFQDVAIVGKWAAKRAKRGWYAPVLLVLRFEKLNQAPGTPQEALKRGIPGRMGAMRFQPKSIWEFIERRYGKMETLEDEPAFKMSSKKLEARYRLLRQKVTGLGGNAREIEKRQLLVMAGEIDTVAPGPVSYGVVYQCTVADAKDMVRPFKTSIKRFRILANDEEEDEEGGATDADIFVDSESKPVLWRAARKRKLESLKGWAALDTENYLIVYNKEVRKPLLKKIAKHIEAIRAQVYEKLFPPAREIKAVSVVRVCKDIAEYRRYGGPAGTAGYWSRGDEELVVPAGMRDSLRVLYHEAFHQYIHYAVGDVAPHSWFNEGHGDYFAGHNYSARKFKAAPFAWRKGIIASAIGSRTYVPLRDFLKYTQGQYYASAGLCYAQGWSFVYFLREVERRKLTRYKQYWGLLDRYFEAIKRNVESVKEKAFEGLEPAGPEPGTASEPEAAPPALRRLPGLEGPFPGEHPHTGTGPESASGVRAEGETRTSAGPRIASVAGALDAAVDEMLKSKGIDYDQLEKDWIAFSKSGR